MEQLKYQVVLAQTELARVDTWWRRLFFRRCIQSASDALREAQTAYAHVQQLECSQGIPISGVVDADLHRHFERFSQRMQSMLDSAKGWHLFGMSAPMGDNRAWYSSPMMQRTACTVGFGRPAFFNATDDPQYQNTPSINCADGLSLYFYPTFILVQRSDAFGLLLPQDLIIEVDDVCVAEHDPAYSSVPSEAYTWHYVNKNGTPDQRYTDNPRVPLLDYQRVTLRAPQGLHETFLFTGGAYAFASWLGVRDWYKAGEHYAALQTLSITPVQWDVRAESDATYFAAHLGNKEVLGFAITRHVNQQLWVCLNTVPLGVVIHPECEFDIWIGGLHLELGFISGVTRRIGADDATFRILPGLEGRDRALLGQCFGAGKEVLVLVRHEDVPIVRLRLAMADPAPLMQALEPHASVQ